MEGVEKTRTAANSRWSLAGTTALVTGGSKGIGHAIVEELARLGAAVHTCARGEAELQSRLREWAAAGLAVTGSVCDVSSPAERERLMERVGVVFDGKLSILVNNAGTAVAKPATEQTPEDYKLVVSTNLDSAFHLSQLGHPLLKASGRGCVVFVSSMGGLVGVDTMTVYGATKGAVNQLTRGLACEWGRDSIRVNCVAPGPIETRLVREVLTEELVAGAIARTPLRRIGEPEDVAGLVAFLCMPAAYHVNGQVIVVDGGQTINGNFYPSN